MSAAGSTSSTGIGVVGPLELHQAADGQKPFALLVDPRGKSLVFVGRIAAHGVLQPRDAVGRPGVILAAQAEGIVAAGIEHGAIDRAVAVSVAVAAHRLLGDLLPARALDGGGGAGEVFLDEARMQADRVEDLRAAIGLVGRDAHLGHDLQQALADRLDVVLLDLVGLLRQAVLQAKLLEGLEGEIGVHRLGAIARQAAEMMDLADLARFDHQAGLGAQAAADQVMMHGRRRQQRRDGHALGRYGAIRQDQDVAVGQHAVGGLVANPVERLLESGRALAGGPGSIDRRRAEGAVQKLLDGADFLQL